MAEWFKDWFGAEYATLYAHRDKQEAEDQVSFLFQLLEKHSLFSKKDNQIFLDIACGAARHISAIQARGKRCLGIDLSLDLLKMAKSTSSSPALIAQADMRALPFSDSSFDGITNFFTSFGYLENDEVHIKLLKEWRRVIKDDAFLFMDFLNRDRVISTLEPHSSKEFRDFNVKEERKISENGERVIKDIEISSKKDASEVKRYQESVRLYNRAEIKNMLETAGFKLQEQFGNFNGGSPESDSPRLISFARAAA